MTGFRIAKGDLALALNLQEIEKDAIFLIEHERKIMIRFSVFSIFLYSLATSSFISSTTGISTVFRAPRQQTNRQLHNP